MQNRVDILDSIRDISRQIITIDQKFKDKVERNMKKNIIQELWNSYIQTKIFNLMNDFNRLEQLLQDEWFLSDDESIHNDINMKTYLLLTICNINNLN